MTSSQKAHVLHTLLQEHRSVFVHFDARLPSVQVPAEYKNRPQLALEFGLNLPVPIRDLRIDITGLSATLSFNRRPSPVFVPWHAIYLIIADTGRGAVWEADAPPEADTPGKRPAGSQETPSERTASTTPPAESRRTLPPNWRVIDGGGRGKKQAS